jgi:LPXTG-site transpeptidase (sortase) family protein
MDADAVCEKLSARFREPWKTSAGDLLMEIVFLRTDTELHTFPVDRLINTLLITLDEAGTEARGGGERRLSDSMEAIGRKLEIRRCLERALEMDELEVFLQPIVDSATGKRIAAEALVRLRDEQGKIIRPDLFITLAERDGYIIRLGEQVLRKVCRFIRDHGQEVPEIRWINVNLSPNQFMARDIPERFREILEEYGVSPDAAIGTVSTPTLDLELPLYLGAGKEQMAKGAAVLGGTSLPIGGKSTNCVIAGHRGYRGIPYFRNLDRLDMGDEVIVTNFWGTLTYSVTGTQIIQPNDLDAILIENGKDKITPLTCHPYTVGTKRLLIFCERTP